MSRVRSKGKRVVITDVEVIRRLQMVSALSPGQTVSDLATQAAREYCDRRWGEVKGYASAFGRKGSAVESG